MTSELLIILALILLNGVFAGAEIAIISIRKTRLAELVERKKPGAKAVAELRARPERFLATVQVGISVVSATAAAFGGATLARELTPLLARVPGIGDSAGDVALGIVVVGVSFLSIILGELVPKSLALRKGETYALLIGRPMTWLSSAARPVVWLLTATSNLVLRLFGDKTSFSEARLSREELQQLMEEATSAGSVDADAGEIASRALDFDERVLADIMVPRGGIRALPLRVSADALFELARTGTHARYPVHAREPEDFVGLVQLREALVAARAGGEVDLEPFLHPLPFLPETMPAPEVLRSLQKQRVHLAMAVDEHGSITGLVSVEDLLEELVGEIMGEDEGARLLYRKQPDGSLLVDGAAPIHELNRELDICLPEGETWSTVAGLCIDLAGRIPVAGESFSTDTGLRVEVLEATPRMVRRVRIQRLEPAEEAEAAEEARPEA